MTLATRNRFVLFATIITALLSITTIIATVLIYVHKILPDQIPGIRQVRGLDTFFLTPYSSLASILSLNVYPIIAFITLSYVIFAFEKTQSVEITFFAACIFAFSLEALRIFIPLYALWDNTNFYSMAIARIILSSRIFIALGLLSSGLFTTGATSQQLGAALFLEFFLSFTLARAIPLDATSVSSNFLILPGYRSTIFTILVIIIVLTIFIYLILAKTKGITEYKYVALAVFILFLGLAFLAISDTWLFLAFGVTFSSLGGLLFLKKIHEYYLWQ